MKKIFYLENNLFFIVNLITIIKFRNLINIFYNLVQNILENLINEISEMIIIKIGGGKEINFDYIAEDLKNIVNKEKVIIVLGANYYRNKLAEELGIKIKIIESESGYKSVYSDQQLIDLMMMAYAGLAAKKLTSKLIQANIKAISLSGIDDQLIIAKRKKFITAKIENKIKLIDNDYSGKIEQINKELLDYLLAKDYVIIITPPAISYEGEILNVDNDQIVVNLAKIYHPQSVIFLIEAPGILKNNMNEEIIEHLKIAELENLIRESSDYGFQKKLLNIKRLTEFNIPKIIIADGRIEKPISRALNSIGTVISSD